MIMHHPLKGNVDSAGSGYTVEELKKDGWIESKQEDRATIEPQVIAKRKPGPKPKNS